MKIAAILLAFCLLTACGPATVVPTPAPISSFDSTAYTILTATQATIEALKLQAPAMTPAAKVLLDQTITAYNLTESAWQLYHAGGAGSPSQAALQAQLDFLKAALGLLGEN